MSLTPGKLYVVLRPWLSLDTGNLLLCVNSRWGYTKWHDGCVYYTFLDQKGQKVESRQSVEYVLTEAKLNDNT